MRQLLRRAMSAALPRRLFMTSGPATSSAVCLTFDDGPHPDYTPAVLDLLDVQGVKATFFLVGDRARQHPEIVSRIVTEGHAIGNHSESHSEPATTSSRRFLEEVTRTNELLASLVGQTPRMTRPPKGKLTAQKLAGLWRLGQTVVLWNRDPKDYCASDSQSVRDWFQREPTRGGDIVLLHDTHPHAARALPEAIAEMKQRGTRFTTPLEWMLS